MTAPEISIVIPVYNEEAILHAAVVDLRERLAPLDWRYEVVLAENGSKDATARVGAELAAKYPEVRCLSIGSPNYGAALREGIERARGRIVICEEIDLCDTDFHQQAVRILAAGGVDLVIGSKLIAEGLLIEAKRLRRPPYLASAAAELLSIAYEIKA